MWDYIKCVTFSTHRRVANPSYWCRNFLHHLSPHLRFVGVTTVVTFSGPPDGSFFLMAWSPLVMLVFNKAWQYMNFGKLLHHFCVMHQISGYLRFEIIFENKKPSCKFIIDHCQWYCRNCPSGYNLHGSRFEGCCWFGIHGHGAPGPDDCHLNSIDGTLARFEMRARKMVAEKRETWYLLFI